MRKKLTYWAIAGLALVSVIGKADAAVVFYTTQATFNAAAPGATLIENFSGAPQKDTPLASLTLPWYLYGT